MIKVFEEIAEKAKKIGPKTMAVAVCQDEDILKSVNYAYEQGIVNPILIGDRKATEKIAKDLGIDLSRFELIDVEDKKEACKLAVKTVHDKKADMVMKGFTDTSMILRAVLDKQEGLMDGGLISHVGVVAVRAFDRPFIVTDSAMNIAPGVEDKVNIINNAVKVAHALGIDTPKVAMICAVEKVSKKMPATVEAKEVVEIFENGGIKGCIVGGPFAIDNAVSEEAAKHKGIDHPVAGNADVLVAPDIEAGNILNKSMEYFGQAEKAGIIMGAKTPIVLTSRASSGEAKFNSIALGVLVSNII